MSQPPTIKDVLTEEGYERFLEKGVGQKLSGTTFDRDDPANGLFWAMFRRAEEQRREADTQDAILNDLRNYVKWQARLIVRLEKTIARLAMEATDDHAWMEACSDGD